MCIESDFNPQIAARMREELSYYEDICYYDKNKKKIVYRSLPDAMIAYNEIQMHKMKQSKMDEIRKKQNNLGDEYDIEWIASFSKTFRQYWKTTHVFIWPEM